MKEKKEINVFVGTRVKAARENAGLTQEKFGELIGVSTQYVSDLERGVVGIALSTVKRICQTLSISSDQIIFENTVENNIDDISQKLRRMSPVQLDFIHEMVNKFILTTAMMQRENNL